MITGAWVAAPNRTAPAAPPHGTKARQKCPQRSAKSVGAVLFRAYCTEAIKAYFDEKLARPGHATAEEEDTE